VTKLDVRWLGKTATLLLYFSITFFYVGVGFDVGWIEWLGYGFGIPGLVLYYVVGVQYVGDMQQAIAAREADSAAG
jgi:hypothetical protein